MGATKVFVRIFWLLAPSKTILEFFGNFTDTVVKISVGDSNPIQASAGGMFLEKENCMANDDCELRLMQSDDLDICGGGDVIDGDASEGTHYRYVVTQHFPYLIQCFRGAFTNN